MGWITDGLKDIGDSLIDGIDSMLKNTGEWAASILDTGIKAYNNFIDVAYNTVVRDIKDGSFDDFWNIVNYMNNVFSIVASTLLVFLFAWSLFNVSVQNKSEVDIVSVIYDLAKLSIGVFLVAHALDIVLAIFQFGTKAAVLSVGSIDENFKITNPEQGLSPENEQLFKLGVSGIIGLLITIVAIIGAIVMMACAVLIIYEIYKRFFKIFCVIPFASISLSTYIMADGHGNEIFKGYLKNVLAMSLEAVVIVLCLGFSASLSNSGQDGFMASLFNIESDLNLREVTLENSDDAEQFYQYCQVNELLNSSIGDIDSLNFHVSSNYAEAMSVSLEGNKYSGELGSFDYYYIIPGETVTVDEDLKVQIEYPVTAYVGNDLGVGPALLLILQCIVPMILTAGAVKEAPVFCSKALGM